MIILTFILTYQDDAYFISTTFTPCFKMNTYMMQSK